LNDPIVITVIAVCSTFIGFVAGQVAGRHRGRQEGIDRAMSRIGAAVRAEANGAGLAGIDWDAPVPPGLHGRPRGQYLEHLLGGQGDDTELERLIGPEGAEAMRHDLANIADLINPKER
jgi:hypothetical protein